MKKINSLILSFILGVISIYAQITVKETGRVIIGSEITGNDAHNVLSMQILGKEGSSMAGSKLTFGDFGRYEVQGWNVFVGEYGSTDTDRMWIHGKNGVYFTWQRDSVFAYYDISQGNKFTFNCDVYSQGLMITSDERFKTNIVKIDSAYTLLRRLNGVSYNYNLATTKVSTATASESDTNLSAKESSDVSLFDELNNKGVEQQSKEKRLGFIAQDLNKVFPELVHKDSTGYFHIDYIGLIPVLVEAIKVQASQIETLGNDVTRLEQQIEELIKQVANSSQNDKSITRKSISTDVAEISEDAPFLYQNTPNPFNLDTTIRYSIPTNAQSAMICIFDMQGSLLVSQPINQVGEGELSINSSKLTPGMYLYSLLINGQEIDTKKMILTK